MDMFEANDTSINDWYILEYSYVVLTALMSSLSIIGCFAIFTTYFAFAELQCTGRLLLVFLSIADLLTAIRQLVAEVHPVIPRKPAGTEGMDEADLAALVTRDSMIGCGLAMDAT